MLGKVKNQEDVLMIFFIVMLVFVAIYAFFDRMLIDVVYFAFILPHYIWFV